MKVDANDHAVNLGSKFAGVMRASRDIALQDAIGKDSMGAKDFLAFDPTQDPTSLLGRRWLCRGGASLWVGKSGIGKSSLLMQAAVQWAVGQPFFGMKPSGALKSVVIQSENDLGDLSEECRGVIEGHGMAWAVDEIHNMVRYYSQSELSGHDFLIWLEKVMLAESPDLIWIDPLFAFLGGDSNKQDVVGSFLRQGLNPLIQRHRAAACVVHHTPKPPKDKNQLRMQGIDLSYAGSGSAELTNWARAVMVLMPGAEGQYDLIAAKRGDRAGLTHPDGQATQQILLEHAPDNRICWMQVPPKQEAEMSTELDDIALCKILTNEQITKTQLVQKVADSYKCSRADARSLVESVVTRHKLFELKSEDGIKHCGMFNAVTMCNTLRFILSPNT